MRSQISNFTGRQAIRFGYSKETGPCLGHQARAAHGFSLKGTMMEFRIELKMEVEDEADALSTRVPINVQLICRGGRWQAQSTNPPLCTELCDTLEKALGQAAKEAASELRQFT